MTLCVLITCLVYIMRRWRALIEFAQAQAQASIPSVILTLARSCGTFAPATTRAFCFDHGLAVAPDIRPDTPFDACAQWLHRCASASLSMASLAAAAPKPIKALFAEAEALLRKVEDCHDAEDATTCVSLLDEAWAAAAALDLFPAGCTGDDVATADLRYALIPDLRARARSRVRCTDGPAGRLALVERCRKDRARFLELAAALDPEVAERGDDDDTDDGAARAPSALDVRRAAIERHEAKKRCAEALAEAQRALRDAQTPEERDELERDVIIAELRSHAAACKRPLLVMIGSSIC